MSFLPRLPGPFGLHAVSVAANARDGLRTARYFLQELASADDPAAQGDFSRRAARLLPADAPSSLITGFIAQNARFADKVMHWSSDAAAAFLAPDGRVQVSPFDRNLLREIKATESFTANALFNAYFHQASVQILASEARPPFLVLENRIDAARRALVSAKPDASDVDFMTRALVALVRAAPIAEAGAIDPRSALAKTKDPNVAVAAIAGMALLYGEHGKPTEASDEDQFFGIVGALIAPRLAGIERLIQSNDLRKLEAELAALQAMY